MLAGISNRLRLRPSNSHTFIPIPKRIISKNKHGYYDCPMSIDPPSNIMQRGCNGVHVWVSSVDFDSSSTAVDAVASDNDKQESLSSTAEVTSKAIHVQASTPPFHPLCILGICGPIGSGKSYACSLLVSQLNCTHHIDTDSLAHSLYDATKYPQNHHLLEEIRQAFGPEVLHDTDGTVNRQALGRIVFGNSSAMTTLERIVWPHLKQRLIDQLRDIQNNYQDSNLNITRSNFSSTVSNFTSTDTPLLQTNKYIQNINLSSSIIQRPIIVVEAAVLIDTHWDDDGLFDAIWAIEASIDTSTQRLVHKRGMKHGDALQRLTAQQARRGIGNLFDELQKGVVTAKIINDVDCHDLQLRHNHTTSTTRRTSDPITENPENILLDRLKRALIDPSCWKPGRYPLI